jgi:hypothetical protein
VTGTTSWQIVTYVLSAIGSLIGILVAVFRVYPAFNLRVAKLREAGIKPTLKRVVFLDRTLSKYRPLLERSERADSLQAVVAQTMTTNSRLSRDGSASNASSASAIVHAPPLLLSLSATQIGHMVRGRPSSTFMVPNVIHGSLLQVAGIAPAYSDYRQLIIDNRLSGNFIASNSESALTFALEEIGISKKLHVYHIMIALMQLKSGDETALAAASSHPLS